MRTKAYASVCEWDIGLDGKAFASEPALKKAQKKALLDCGIDDNFEELESEGLVGTEIVEIVGDINTSGNLSMLTSANRIRQKVWPGSEDADVLFRAVEFGGESGELLDAVKKLTRMQRGIAGNVGYDLSDLRQAVMEEVGDVLIALDMLTDKLGVHMADCVPMKFNKTSRKVGLDVYMTEDWKTSFGDTDAQLPLFHVQV